MLLLFSFLLTRHSSKKECVEKELQYTIESLCNNIFVKLAIESSLMTNTNTQISDQKFLNALAKCNANNFLNNVNIKLKSVYNKTKGSHDDKMKVIWEKCHQTLSDLMK